MNDGLESVLKKVTKFPATITKDFIKFYIDLNQIKDKELVESLKEVKLPNIRKVFIQGLPGVRTEVDVANLQQFLRVSLPDNLPTFGLYNDSGSNWKYLEDYFDAAERALKTVKREVYIFGFRMKASTLVRLFQTCPKVERISLVNCEIGDGDFTLPQPPLYQIKSLNISSNT